jgi:hypothetical protein
VAGEAVEGTDATLVNMDDAAAWTAGEISSTALAFDGVDDYLLISKEGEEFLSLQRDFTWAAWVSTGVGGTILSKSPTELPWAPGAVALFVRGGALTVDVGWVGFVASLRTVTDGLWHHVAATARFDVAGDADEIQLYIDGVPDGFWGGWDLEAAGPPPGDLKAGFASPDFPVGASHLSGSLDEIRIWDRALTQEEIWSVYENPGDLCEEGPAVPVFRRGDADAADGEVNITDAIFVLNYLFQGGGDPPCLDAADADDEFGINITDGIRILNFLFTGGTDPPSPGPFDCGPDSDAPEPTPPLDCRTYPPACP